MKVISKYIYMLSLGIVFGMSFLLRWNYVKDNLYFGYEQGRDAYQAMDIWNGKDFALVGPKTDIAGIFHGPIFFYILSVLYGVSGGNPWAASLTFITISSISVVLLVLIVYQLTKSKSAMILAGILGAISLESINYGTWLSNVPLSLPFNLLALSAFIQYLRTAHNKWWFIGLVNVLIAMQFEIILLFEWSWIIILLTIFKRTISFKQFGAALLLGAMSMSWLLVFNVRHDWILFSAIQNYAQESHSNLADGILGLVSIYKTIFFRTQYLPELFKIPVMLIFLLVLFKYVVVNRRQEIGLVLLFAFMSLPTMLFPNSVKLDQLHVNLGIGLIILISVLLFEATSNLKPWSRAAAVGATASLLIVLNIYSVFHHDGMFFESSKGLTIAAQKSRKCQKIKG